MFKMFLYRLLRVSYPAGSQGYRTHRWDWLDQGHSGFVLVQIGAHAYMYTSVCMQTHFHGHLYSDPWMLLHDSRERYSGLLQERTACLLRACAFLQPRDTSWLCDLRANVCIRRLSAGATRCPIAVSPNLTMESWIYITVLYRYANYLQIRR